MHENICTAVLWPGLDGCKITADDLHVKWSSPEASLFFLVPLGPQVALGYVPVPFEH